MHADMMDDENVWMIESTGCLSFLLETIEPISVLGKGSEVEL